MLIFITEDHVAMKTRRDIEKPKQIFSTQFLVLYSIMMASYKSVAMRVAIFGGYRELILKLIFGIYS